MIHLSKEIKSKTSKGVTTKDALYFMYVQKDRNYDGPRIIENWMREPSDDDKALDNILK